MKYKVNKIAHSLTHTHTHTHTHTQAHTHTHTQAHSLGVDDHDQSKEEDEERISLQEVVVPHHSPHLQPTLTHKQASQLEREG